MGKKRIILIPDGSGNDNLTLCLFFRSGAEYGAAGEHTGSDARAHRC